MKDRIQAISTALMAVLLLMLSSGVASAHSISLTAEAVCNGAPTINFTVTSWSGDALGENSKIEVSFNNIVVLTSALSLASGNVITGSLPAPSGTSVLVSAFVAATWPSGEPGGQTSSTTVTIPSNCAVGSGRFTGGGKQVDLGGVAKITRGLTIHCDLLLSNNLEINWDGGNNFHMLEHAQTIECSDDPAIDQKPPSAPLDTLRGIGFGRLNGVDGYKIEFTLVDAGEPGTSDQMGFVITAPNGTVVLNIPVQNLTGGNLQAHFDQPHKDK